MAIIETLVGSTNYYHTDVNTVPAITEEELNLVEDQWLCDMGIDLAKIAEQIEYEYGFRFPVMILAKLTVNDLNSIRELNCVRTREEE